MPQIDPPWLVPSKHPNPYVKDGLPKLPPEVAIAAFWQIGMATLPFLFHGWLWAMFQAVFRVADERPIGFHCLEAVIGSPYLWHAGLIFRRGKAYQFARFLVWWTTVWGLLGFVLVMVVPKDAVFSGFVFYGPALLLAFPLVFLFPVFLGGLVWLFRRRQIVIRDCLWRWETDQAEAEIRQEALLTITQNQSSK